MPVDRTRLKFRLFDRLRKRAQQPNSLELLKYSPTAGYQLVKTLTAGFYGQRVTRHALGGEFFEVQIAENGTDLSPTFRDRLSHLKLDKLYYSIQGVEAPKGVPKVYLLRCEPMGQRTLT